ncbi:G/U mismatch-specific DNA glycosylase [Phormidium tenue FACHB-886]|nr:G/U mismatch-specific DNA glycosylase [Phormidium tenue FACHB-886]
MLPHKPTKAQIQAALNTTVPDIIAPNLQVLFCGINPSLYSAAVGHHFARPGNRFWKALHAAGFTDRLFSPFEDQDLLKVGYGITNIVDRATATADQLAAEELLSAFASLTAKVQQYRPRCLAVLGISAYRTAFRQPKAIVGRQADLQDTIVWVLPNPSGLNAHYQLADLGRVYAELKAALL